MDLLKEEMLTLTEAARVLPTGHGKAIHISTLWRWCRKGIKGRRLEYVRAGRRIFTSKEAIGRFMSLLAEDDARDSAADTKTGCSPRFGCGPKSPARRSIESRIETAERELAAVGL
jgi:hypothetical protein